MQQSGLIFLVFLTFRLIKKATDKIANIKALTSERAQGLYVYV